MGFLIFILIAFYFTGIPITIWAAYKVIRFITWPFRNH